MFGSNDDTTATDEGQRTVEEDVRDLVDRVVDLGRTGFDEGVVDLLSALLETETSTRVYVYLRQHPGSTHEDVADGTGLYPATVEGALDDLADSGAVERRGREDGDHEYVAVPPSDLVGDAFQGIPETVGEVADSTVRDDDGDRSARLDVDSGSSAEAEFGEAEADVDTDLEGEAELDEDGARLEGEAGGEVDVETADGDATVEGSVDATVGTDGVDVEVDAEVETPADEAEVDAEVEAAEDGVETDAEVDTPDDDDETDAEVDTPDDDEGDGPSESADGN